jgi:L-lactate oxidase
VLLKGVMSPELAVAAVEHSCAGIQVSNHGGRQLDDVAASISVLPRIVDVVRGRTTIIIDGGVRRGQDVLKALALGADAVAVGRPVLYGLALGGWMGVQAVLEHLDGELEMTMRLAGAQTIAEISRSYVATGPEA